MKLRYFEKVARHYWRIAIVTGALRSTDSERKGAIKRIAKTNRILNRPVKKLFTVENTYHNSNQTDKVREQKLGREVAVIGVLKRKYEC